MEFNLGNPTEKISCQKVKDKIVIFILGWKRNSRFG